MKINPLASPSAGAPALKYGDVNTVTPSPGEAKGLITSILIQKIFYFFDLSLFIFFPFFAKIIFIFILIINFSFF